MGKGRQSLLANSQSYYGLQIYVEDNWTLSIDKH